MNKMILLLTALCIPMTLLASGTPIQANGVAAAVGDSVVLRSDVDEMVQMKLAQSGGTADLVVRNMLYSQSLEEIIDGLVLLVHSAKDSNIVVTSTEISQQVDNRISSITKQNKITEEQLAKALEAEQNMTMSAFRDKLSQQVQQDLVRQRVQQFYLAGSELSRSEVRTFYGEYKDSLPSIGESIKLQKLEIALQPDSVVRQNAYEAAIAIRQKTVENGEDFLGLAQKLTSDKVKPAGGDLGFVSKGTLAMISIEQAIFTLQPGEVSHPIETRLGFHLVKVLERRDNKVHALHILIPVQPSPAVVKTKTALLDSIGKASPDFEAFGKVIAVESTEPVSRAYKGEMEWQTVASMDKSVKSSISSLAEGAFSSVISQDNSLYLYRVFKYEKNRQMNLESDWTQIEQYARQTLMQKRLDALVKSWRKDVFIQKYQ